MKKIGWLGLLLGFSLGCHAMPPEPVRVGADKDTHGCIASAGYSWCEAKRQCVRAWELPPVPNEGESLEARFVQHCTKRSTASQKHLQ